MPIDEKEFPARLYVRWEKDGDTQNIIADEAQDAGGKNGDLIAVYRLSHVRRLTVSKTLSLVKQ